MAASRDLLVALAVRLAIALTIRTAFAPDEFWQSIEVAYRLVFGNGHLTWEWAAGLRSYAHPLLFAAPYAALRALRLDCAWAVVRVPLLLQALVAAGTDVYVARLAGLLLGPQAAIWCLACQLASWFNAYCLGRTYSNSLEAALTAAGAFHWLRCRGAGPAGQAGGSGGKAARSKAAKAAGDATARRRDQRAWIAAAALCVVFRPASALFWVAPATLELARQRGATRRALLVDASAVGGGLLGAAALLDRAFYGRWVAVPWEFFRFNLLAGASAQYGSHPWHWNLTQGLPTVAASLAPLLAAGVAWAGPGARRHAALLAAWSVAAYSLPAHKEFRFLLPALQLLMPYCGLAAARLLGSSSSVDSSGSSTGSSGAASRAPAARPGEAAAPEAPPRWQRWGAAACLALQLPVALYFLLVHQGAQVGVMRVLQREAAAWPPGTASVLFLTPCHATPYTTHVHARGPAAALPMRFLDCTPPQYAAATAALNARTQAWLPLPPRCPAAVARAASNATLPDAGAAAVLSERRCFEADPEAYLSAMWGAPGSGAAPPLQPFLLVGYAPLMEALAAPLRGWGYVRRHRLLNCWVQTDGDSPCELQVWALRV